MVGSKIIFPAPDTSKSCNLHSGIANWNYNVSGWVGSTQSNRDYKAISASQQSWSFDLAELGNSCLGKTFIVVITKGGSEGRGRLYRGVSAFIKSKKIN